MNGAEYRQMSVQELQEELHKLMQEQFNLRVQRATDQMSKPHLFNQVRRNIARVKTILNEKARA
jgi:large subunit ribosomal protein L29